MKKFNELVNCSHADGLQSNVPTRCDEDEQLKEKFGIIDQLAAMLRGKKISQERGYVRISFRIFLLVMAVGLAGGFYYLGTQGRQNVGIDQAQVEKLVKEQVAAELAKAEEARRAAEQKVEEARRAAESAKAEEARQESINDAAVVLDVAQGMPEYLARYKQKKIARARQAVVGLKALGADAKQLQEAEQTLANVQRMTQKEWEDKISYPLKGWRGFFIFIALAMLSVSCCGGDRWAARRYSVDRYNLLLVGYTIFAVALLLVGPSFLAPWLACAFA